MSRRDSLRHTSEDVGRALRFQRGEFLPHGRRKLLWAATVIDWAYAFIGPAEMKQIKMSVDAARR